MAKQIHRAEDRLIHRVDLARNAQGTNGIAKPFALRPVLDWKILLALKFEENGKRRAI